MRPCPRAMSTIINERAFRIWGYALHVLNLVKQIFHSYPTFSMLFSSTVLQNHELHGRKLVVSKAMPKGDRGFGRGGGRGGRGGGRGENI